MKTTAVIIGLCVAILEHALAQTNQIVAPIVTNAPIKALPTVTKPTPLVMPKKITTRAGIVYKNTKIARIDPSGLTISYSMAGGGLGITKITFDQLPPDLQKECGYDPQAAAEFQAGEKQAAAQWAAKMTADEKEGKIKIAEREKQEEEAAKEAKKAADEERKIKAAELAAAAAKQAAEAAMIQATNPAAITITNRY
jgi:hypothetical protein